jgi:lysophospholipase L1-like esterase
MKSDTGDSMIAATTGSRARQILRATAYGGGGVGMVGVLTAGLLYGQAAMARRAIPLAESPPPRSDGRYGTYPLNQPDIRLALIGDSSAAGFGVDRARDTTGALLAVGIAEQMHRNVYVRCYAIVGATSASLGAQADRVLSDPPDIAVILIGANDVTHRERVPVAVRHLAGAVRRLRDAGADVVVCTCPDLGTVQPIPRPLRWLARRWSRELAAAQTVAAVDAGARTVSLGDLLGPQFASAPDRMFGSDGFHPSAIGYAAAAGAILPTVLATLRLASGAGDEGILREGEGVRSLVRAAAEAATSPGTEVSAAQVSGAEAGPAGRWAQLRHRVRQLVERPQDPSVTSAPIALTNRQE